MVAALQGFTTLAIVIGVGWLLARTRVADRAAQKALGDVAFFAGQPALVLIAVADADLDLLIGPHVAAFGVACILCGLAFATLQRRLLGASRAEAAVPAMLLAFGMSLFDNRMPPLHRLPRETLAAIATKSLLVPAVAWGLGLALGLDGLPLRAAVILAALPTAQIVFVHSLRYQVATPLVQATTLWSTVFSVPVILLATLVVG